MSSKQFNLFDEQKSEVKDGETIVVWFSCGAASAVAAYLTVKQYGDRCNVRLLNNPVAEEDDDNRRFLKDVELWVGKEIESVTNSKYPSASAEEVWKNRKYMSGVAGAPCTVELKKEARMEWERNNIWHHCVLGFTVEEKKRHDRFILTERQLLPVLIENNFTKQDCIDFIINHDIDPPRMYKLGYPNANCIGCVKASGVTYWNHVRQVHPEIFKRRAEQSREIGVKLVRYKGERIYLDELPEEAKGQSLKSMDIDCGSFCEETSALDKEDGFQIDPTEPQSDEG
jgi:hypothetical protein